MSIRLIAGDCRDVLPTLAADSVQCCITSPPYYALRSYLDATHPDKHREIGSESSPDAYLATMVAVFREVRRVLRPDGTCWVNMGDSYATSSGAGAAKPRERDLPNAPTGWASRNAPTVQRTAMGDYKPKDLLLMPARLALALQSDGWWVRSDIIWCKPNPMPESCTDRPTSAHEHVFLLTKSARYFFDNDAIREPHTSEPIARNRHQNGGGSAESLSGDCRQDFGRMEYHPVGRSCRNVWTIATSPFSAAHFATFPPELAERCIRAGTSERGCCAACGAPWRRITERGAERVMRSENDGKGYVLPKDQQGEGLSRYGAGKSATFVPNAHYEHTTTGWAPGCKCQANYDCSGLGCGHQPCICIGLKPCTVLDPFAGAGTTLLVADRLQRDAIGIELNAAYTEMAMERCRADAPLFADMHPPPAEDPEDERMRDLFAEAE